MAFSNEQRKALAAKLHAKYVKTRRADGVTLFYIEGWHAIAEANRIFGFEGWDRQTVNTQCVWKGRQGGREACTYIAKVRIRVRAGAIKICREASGAGHGVGELAIDAHESAIKEAETDATKRALATFGNPFGLALYDKEQRAVRGKAKHSQANERLVSWIVLTAEGAVYSVHEDPAEYCSAMRRLLENSPSVDRLKTLWSRNLATVAMLQANLPDLKSEAGEHYADVLLRLYEAKLHQLFDQQRTGPSPNAVRNPVREPNRKTEAQSDAPSQQKRNNASFKRPQSNQGPGRETKDELGILGKKSEPNSRSSSIGRIDKSALHLSLPRRLRDKAHLRYVARQPCLVCGRSPTHAHHLRFAQPASLGQKVSDEWAVPLCATHHREVHSVGDEKRWWAERKIDCLAAARQLWDDTRTVRDHRTVDEETGNNLGRN